MPKALAALSLACLLGCGGIASGVVDAGSNGASSGGSGSSGSGGGSTSGGSSGSSSGSSGGPVQHRPDDSLCASPTPPGDCMGTGSPIPATSCAFDAECAGGTNGRCVVDNGSPVPICVCKYEGCTHDVDCSAGSTCACHGSPYLGGAGNTCTPSGCRVDADCGPGGFCSPSRDLSGCNGVGVSGYFCHTPADLCTNDSDCPMDRGPAACVYYPSSGRWQCGAVEECL